MSAEAPRLASPCPPTFIVFEGLDGSGKSTSAKRTADRLGALYRTTPSERIRAYRHELVASCHGSQEAAQLFYLSTVFAASCEIRALLAQGRTVVLDRYFLSTQAYAEFRGSTVQVEHLAVDLLPAHVTVFLDPPLAVRESRVAARGPASDADRETLRPHADTRLRELHLARSKLPIVGRFLRLDSSELSPDAIAEIVARACATSAAGGSGATAAPVPISPAS